MKISIKKLKNIKYSNKFVSAFLLYLNSTLFVVFSHDFIALYKYGVYLFEPLQINPAVSG